MKVDLRITLSGMFLTLWGISLTYASPPSSRGARPIALGNGYVAVAGDPYSLYYNPAGLAELGQQEFVLDYGRSHSQDLSARSDFNSIYAFSTLYHDRHVPIAIGLYGDAPANGAHIVDFTMGGGLDAPVDRWTKGLLRFPVRLGVSCLLRQQQGQSSNDRVGKSNLGLGVTGGAYIPLKPDLQFGIAIRNLFLNDADPEGPSISFGLQKKIGQFALVNDFEIHNRGLWNFSPGVEWLLSRGVIRPRMGAGFHDTHNVNLIATGLGVYLSPYQIDFAYLIPLHSPTDNADQFRVSFSYRFGTPHFSDVYYDRALEAASKLDQTVLQMSVREAELKASLAELEQKKRMAREELDNSKARIEALKQQDLLGQRDSKIRSLQNQIDQLQGNLSYERTESKQLRQKQATIRFHNVKAGDTLQTLAKEFYGDPNQWKKIYNANTDKIDRGLPRIGERLVIP